MLLTPPVLVFRRSQSRFHDREVFCECFRLDPWGVVSKPCKKGHLCAGNCGRGACALPAHVCPGRSRNDPGHGFGSDRGRHRRRHGDHHRRGPRRHPNPDHRRCRRVPGQQSDSRHVHGACRGQGIPELEHSGVLVQVSENIRVDLVVQPGEQTQTITVSGEVPAIDTTDSTLGGAVSNNEINSLPLNGRNFQRLLELRPGVVYVTQGGRSGSSSTNGLRTGGDLVLVEGIPQIDQAFGGSSINSAFTTREKIPPPSCPSMLSRSSPARRIPRRNTDSRTARS